MQVCEVFGVLLLDPLVGHMIVDGHIYRLLTESESSIVVCIPAESGPAVLLCIALDNI